MIDALSLYEALGQSKGKFIRWCKRHFTQEEEAKEGTHYFKFEDEPYQSGPGGKWTKYKAVYGVAFDLAITLCDLDQKYTNDDNTELAKWIEEVRHAEYENNNEVPVPKLEKPAYVSNDTSSPVEVESKSKVGYVVAIALLLGLIYFLACC